MERRKLEEKARQDEAEMHNLRSRDKTERPLKKGEFIAAAEKRKQQGFVSKKERGKRKREEEELFVFKCNMLVQGTKPLKRMTMMERVFGTNRPSPTSLSSAKSSPLRKRRK